MPEVPLDTYVGAEREAVAEIYASVTDDAVESVQASIEVAFAKVGSILPKNSGPELRAGVRQAWARNEYVTAVRDAVCAWRTAQHAAVEIAARSGAFVPELDVGSLPDAPRDAANAVCASADSPLPLEILTSARGSADAPGDPAVPASAAGSIDAGGPTGVSGEPAGEAAAVMAATATVATPPPAHAAPPRRKIIRRSAENPLPLDKFTSARGSADAPGDPAVRASTAGAQTGVRRLRLMRSGCGCPAPPSLPSAPARDDSSTDESDGEDTDGTDGGI